MTEAVGSQQWRDAKGDCCSFELLGVCGGMPSKSGPPKNKPAQSRLPMRVTAAGTGGVLPRQEARTISKGTRFAEMQAGSIGTVGR